MDEREKPTLEQVRTLFPFDPAVLAEQAEIPTLVVYHALVMHPILYKDAEKILLALSQHTGLQLSLEKIEIATWETFDLFWVVRTSAHEGSDAGGEMEDGYYLVYARDMAQAAQKAQVWLAHQPHLPYHFLPPAIPGYRSRISVFRVANGLKTTHKSLERKYAVLQSITAKEYKGMKEYPQPHELLLTIEVTHNEIIAMNTAINFYLRHGGHIWPICQETSRLLDCYLHRLNTLIQPEVQGAER